MRSIGAPMRGPDEPIQLESDPDIVSLYWVENIAITSWHKPLTGQAIDELHRVEEPMRKRYPSGMSFVHIGRAELAMIDAGTRDAFVRVLKALEGYIVATAVIARASGFWASTLRSVATGVVFLSRSSAERRVNDNVDEVMSWLPAKHEQATGIKLDHERLRRVMTKAVDTA